MHPCGTRGWLQARAPGGVPDPARRGKWVLRVPCERSSEAWEAVAALVRGGFLGTGAKMACEDCVEEDRRAGLEAAHVLLAYTADWYDVLGVRQVGQLLLRFDLAKFHAGAPIYYKADAQALRGIGGATFFMRAWDGHLLPGRGLAEWARRDLDARRCAGELALY